MHITIKQQRGDIKQLKISVQQDDVPTYYIDDQCGVLTVRTHQQALDSAARYLNTGHVWETGYDRLDDIPAPLRTQA